MESAVARRCVGEMDAERSPGIVEQRTEDAIDQSHRPLRRLPRGLSAAQENRDGDYVILTFNAQAHRLVMKVDVARQRFDRSTDGRLLANHEGDRPEVGKAAALRHSQAKLVGAGSGGGGHQQAADAGHGDAQVRALQASERKPDLFQHVPRLEADRTGDFGVMRQAGAANQVDHALNFKDCPEL